jgi:hypothetical protein
MPKQKRALENQDQSLPSTEASQQSHKVALQNAIQQFSKNRDPNAFEKLEKDRQERLARIKNPPTPEPSDTNIVNHLSSSLNKMRSRMDPNDRNQDKNDWIPDDESPKPSESQQSSVPDDSQPPLPEAAST